VRVGDGHGATLANVIHRYVVGYSPRPGKNIEIPGLLQPPEEADRDLLDQVLLVLAGAEDRAQGPTGDGAVLLEVTGKVEVQTAITIS
jgi:hypothetical protein